MESISSITLCTMSDGSTDFISANSCPKLQELLNMASILKMSSSLDNLDLEEISESRYRLKDSAFTESTVMNSFASFGRYFSNSFVAMGRICSKSGKLAHKRPLLKPSVWPPEHKKMTSLLLTDNISFRRRYSKLRGDWR